MNLTFKSPKHFDRNKPINRNNTKQDLDTLINYVKSYNLGYWSYVETTLPTNKTIKSYEILDTLKKINNKIDLIKFFSIVMDSSKDDGLIDICIDFKNGTRTNIYIYRKNDSWTNKILNIITE